MTRTTGRTAATRHTKIIGKAVIVLVIVACVTDLVSIPILLVHVGYGRAIVGRIAPSVAIHVVFARITNTVAVTVFLVSVHDQATIVGAVEHSITIGIRVDVIGLAVTVGVHRRC